MSHDRICMEETISMLEDQIERITVAVRNLYYAGHWYCDRDVVADELWTQLRDAVGFEPGNAPKKCGDTKTATIAQKNKLIAEAREIMHDLITEGVWPDHEVDAKEWLEKTKGI